MVDGLEVILDRAAERLPNLVSYYRAALEWDDR
jgi:hypothetical protein